MLNNRYPMLLALLVPLLWMAGALPWLAGTAEAASITLRANPAPSANASKNETSSTPVGEAGFALTVSTDRSAQGAFKIVVTGLHVTDLYGYELRLRYDAGKLKFQGATSAIPGFTVTPIVKGDRITFAHTRTGGGQGDNGKVELCALTFSVVGSGGSGSNGGVDGGVVGGGGSVGNSGSGNGGKSSPTGSAVVELLHAKLVDSQVRMTEQDVGARATIALNAGNAAALRDIAGHWAEAAIRQAAELGIVSGYADGMFRPADPITRAEFTAMLIRTLGLPPGDAGKLDFADRMRIPAWAAPSVAAGATAGIVGGYADHTFRPGSLISRAEMAALAVRALGLHTTAGAKTAFADDGDIPAWAQPYVAEAVQAGVLHGSRGNRFLPNAHASRAEAVAMMMALHAKGEIR